MTIFLTTHYMEEAEALWCKVAIIDSGKIIALGSLEELKSQIPANASDCRKIENDEVA